MSVSEQDVRHIAALARLEIADQRIAGLVTELNGILAHMDVLQALDIGDATPADAPADARPDARAAAPVVSPVETIASVLRADTPGAVPLHRERESFAPAFRDGFFVVPRLSTHE